MDCLSNYTDVAVAQTNKSVGFLEVDEFYREVGRRIREFRREKGHLTQETLAESIGLTRTSMTNIERGRQKLLLHTFTRIAATLGVVPNELLPERATILRNLGVDLPTELRADERGFIERTMSPGREYASIKTTRNSEPGERSTGKSQDKRPSR